MRGQTPGRVKIWDSKSHREYHLETNCNHNYGAIPHLYGGNSQLGGANGKINFLTELFLTSDIQSGESGVKSPRAALYNIGQR